MILFCHHKLRNKSGLYGPCLKPCCEFLGYKIEAMTFLGE